MADVDLTVGVQGKVDFSGVRSLINNAIKSLNGGNLAKVNIQFKADTKSLNAVARQAQQAFSKKKFKIDLDYGSSYTSSSRKGSSISSRSGLGSAVTKAVKTKTADIRSQNIHQLSQINKQILAALKRYGKITSLLQKTNEYSLTNDLHLRGDSSNARLLSKSSDLKSKLKNNFKGMDKNQVAKYLKDVLKNIVPLIDEVNKSVDYGEKQLASYKRNQKAAITDTVNRNVSRTKSQLNSLSKTETDTATMQNLNGMYSELIVKQKTLNSLVKNNASNDTIQAQASLVTNLNNQLQEEIQKRIQLNKASEQARRFQTTLNSAQVSGDQNDIKMALSATKSYYDTYNKLLKAKLQFNSIKDASPNTQASFSNIDSLISKFQQYLDKVQQGVAEVGNMKLMVQLATSGALGDTNISPLKNMLQLLAVENQLVEARQKYASLSSAAGVGDQATQHLSNIQNNITAIEQLKQAMQQGTVTQEQFFSTFSSAKGAIDSDVAALKELSQALNENLQLKRQVATANNEQASLQNKLSRAIKNTTAAQFSNKQLVRDAYSNMQALLEQTKQLDANGIQNASDLADFKQKLSSISALMKGDIGVITDAGFNTRTLGLRLSAMAMKFTSWFSVSQIVMQAVNSLRQMASLTLAVDTAMTELKKVTSLTDTTYDNFLNNATDRAKNIGATLTDVINSTADFARLGYTLEDSTGLSNAATIYENVGDDINSIDDASQSIISTMQAFRSEDQDVSDYAMSIVDKFNAVGNKFSISSGGIGEALQRSASAMKEANNSLDLTIALATAANQTVQDPLKVGTSLKTVSMYLRAAKSLLELAGEDTDGMAESVSKLRDYILQVTGNRVDIQLDEDTYKSTYEILKLISQVWDDLSDVSQAGLLEKLGGKRNSNILASIIENFDVAEKALSVSQNSLGSALEENEKRMDSLQGKIDVLKASFQTLSTDVIDSDSAKFFVELGTDILDVTDKVANLILEFGGLKGVIGTITGLVLSSKMGEIFGKFGKQFDAIKASATSRANEIKNIFGSKTDAEILLYQTQSQNKTAQDKTLNNVTQEAVNGANQAVQASQKVSQNMQTAANATQNVANVTQNAAANAEGASTAVQSAALSTVASANTTATVTNTAAVNTGTAAASVEGAANATQSASGASQSASGAVEQASSAAQGASAAVLGASAAAKNAATTNSTNAGDVLDSTGTGTAQTISSTESKAKTIGQAIGKALTVVTLVSALYNGIYSKLLSDQKAKADRSKANADNDLLKFGTYQDFQEALLTYKKYADKSSTLSGQELSDYNDALKTIQSTAKSVDNDIAKQNESLKQSGTDAALASSGIASYSEALSAAAEGTDEYNQALQEMESPVAKQKKKDAKNIRNEYKSALKDSQYSLIFGGWWKSSLDAVNQGLPGKISSFFNDTDLDKEKYAQLQIFGKMKGYVTQTQQGSKITPKGNDAKDLVKYYTDLGLAIDELLDDGKVALTEYFKNAKSTYNSMSDSVEAYEKSVYEFYKDSFISDQDADHAIDNVDDYSRMVTYVNNRVKKELGLTERQTKEFTDELFNADYPEIASKVSDGVTLSAEKIQESFDNTVSLAQNAITSLENVNSALNDAFSGTGLTATIDEYTSELSGDIGAIIDAYQDLDGYDFDKLFIRTANGIQINSSELLKLQHEELRVTKNKFTKQLSDLNEELRRTAMSGGDTSGILAQIQQIEALQSAYEGLTSAYNEWLQSHNQTLAGNVYDTIQSTALDRGDLLLENNYVGTTEFRKLALLFSGKDLADASTDLIVDAYGRVDLTIDGTTYTLRDFYAEGTLGCWNFADALVQLGLASKDALGDIHFDKALNIDDLAEKFGTSSDIILSQLNKMNAMGAQILFLNDEQTKKLEIQNNKFNKAKEQLQKADNGTGKYSAATNFNIEDLNDEQSIKDKIRLLHDLRKNMELDPTVDDTLIQSLTSEIDALQDKLNILNGTTIQPGVNSDTVQLGLNTKSKLLQKLKFDELHGIDAYKDEPTLELARALAGAEQGVKSRVGVSGDTAALIIDSIIAAGDKAELAGNKASLAGDKAKLAGEKAGLSKDKDNKNKVNHTEQAGSGSDLSIRFRTGTSKLTEYSGAGEGSDEEKDFRVKGTQQGGKKVVKIEAQDDTQLGVLSANKTLDKITNKSSSVTADNNTEPGVESSTANINSVPDKESSLSSKDNTASGVKSAKKNISSVPKLTTTTINANDNASSKINSVSSLLNSLNGKVADTTILTKHINTTIYKTLQAGFGTPEELSFRTGVGRLTGTTHGSAFVNGSGNTKLEFDLLKNDPTNKTKKPEKHALVGLVGQELVVNGNQWWTVGDHGAEFTNIPSGSVVFDAWQTKKLLQAGAINSRGNAMLNGTAFDNSTIGGVLKKHYGTGKTKSGYGSKDKNKSSKSSASSAAKSAASAAKSAASAAKSSSDAADESKNTLDEFEILIDRIERDINNLSTVVESTYYDFADRQSSLTDEISKVSQELSYQQQGVELYRNKANSVGLSEDWAQKVRDGKVNIDDIQNNDLLYDKIQDYQTWYEKMLDCEDLIVTLKEKLSLLFEQRFDIRKTGFLDVITDIQDYSDLIQSYMDLTEEQGYVISKLYYKEQITSENKILDNMKKLRDALVNDLADAVVAGKIEEDSLAFYDLQSQIDEVNNSIIEGEKSIEEFNNAIREIDWNNFDKQMEYIDAFADEMDLMYDLLGDSEKFFDKDNGGQFTNKGAAALTLRAMQYDTYLKLAQYEAEKISETDKQLAKDPYNTTLLDHRKELVDAYHDYMSSANDAKEAMVDLVKDGIDAQVDSLNDLIDKYEDLIDSDKSAIEYARQIEEAQDKINTLNKEIMSWQGDTSEEGAASRQQAQSDLKTAQQDLADTQEDRRIEELKSTLDTLSTNFELILNERIDNIDALISNVITGINDNQEAIVQELSTLAGNWGLKMSTAMNETFAAIKEQLSPNILQGKQDLNKWIYGANSDTKKAVDGVAGAISGLNGLTSKITDIRTNLLSSYFGSKFTDNFAAVFRSIDNIKENIWTLVESQNKKAKKDITKAKSDKNAVKKKVQLKKKAAPKKTTPKKSTKTLRSDKDYYGVALAIINGNYGYGNEPQRRKKVTAKGYDYDRVKRIVNELWNAGLVKSGAWLGKYYGLRRSDLGKYTYKSGAKSIKKDQLAWTSEGGKAETIIRRSDNAIYTPLKKGDSVLSSKATENLWNIANNPNRFLADSAASNAKMINRMDTSSTDVNSTVVFNLPNVKNYSEFMNAAKSDPKFQKMIQLISLGQAKGNNKYKVRNIDF